MDYSETRKCVQQVKIQRRPGMNEVDGKVQLGDPIFFDTKATVNHTIPLVTKDFRNSGAEEMCCVVGPTSAHIYGSIQ